LKANVTLMATGDVILDLEGHDRAFEHVKHVIRESDVAIANCDQVLSDLGETPNGFWPIYYCTPVHAEAFIDSIVDAGFSIVNLCNNHSVDWGYEALFDSLEQCEKRGLTPLGIGRTLGEARRPVVVEVNDTRLAFLAYNCVGPAGYEATDIRPGNVPLRIHTHYEQWDPQPGTPPLIHTFAHKPDLASMVRDISKTREKVDVVVVNFHWGVHYIPELIADYQYEVGHAAIDAGADIVFGNHAHLPKGIEVYKGKAIFYGMHNFACPGEWDLPSSQPGSLYPESHHWDYSSYGALFAERFGKIPPELTKPSMIAKAVIEKGKIAQVSYLPCWIDESKRPRLVSADSVEGQAVFTTFEKISRSQGLETKFNWHGHEVIIDTNIL